MHAFLTLILAACSHSRLTIAHVLDFLEQFKALISSIQPVKLHVAGSWLLATSLQTYTIGRDFCNFHSTVELHKTKAQGTVKICLL